MAPDSQLDLLRKIDSKIGALLAISIDEYLRNHPEVAKPRPRTIDQLLLDVGLPVKEIASLLGKSEQAVYLQLGKKSKSKSKDRGGASDEKPDARPEEE